MAMLSLQLLVWPVLLVFLALQGVSASGYFTIKLLSFTNPGGKDNSGRVCDGPVIGKCDHYFKVCIDEASGRVDDYDTCRYGNFRTEAIQEENSNTFGDTIGSKPNKRRFNFTHWPGEVLVKVKVKDEDPFASDLVEELHTKVSKQPVLSKLAAGSAATSYLIRQRTRLDFEMAVFCDPDYYGPHCGVHCVPQENNHGKGHYDCREDGTKLCAPGWTGANCENAVDECASSPCSAEGGICKDHVNGFSCICHMGFTGTLCEVNIDDCATQPCLNAGSCNDLVNGFNCSCPQGWTGHMCERVAEGCSSSPCGSGTCVQMSYSYVCQCPFSYTGLHCETPLYACQSLPCQNNGTCLPEGTDEYSCECKDGWVGDDCADNFDDCKGVTCVDNMECVDLVAGYQCICPGNSTCPDSSEPCKDKPCKNEGQCIPGTDSYICRCPDHFKGSHCQYLAANCSTDPCYNDGTCQETPEGNTCICPEGFSGVICQIKAKDKVHQFNEPEPCLSDPCQNNGTCQNQGQEAVCICPLGIAGKFCSTILNECTDDFCNGSGQCVSIGGERTCTCHHGYTGTRCESKVPDACLSNPCLNDGVCESHGTYFLCRCTVGYTGFRCESDINECAFKLCKNGGTCENTAGSYYCACPEDFTGQQCESAIVYNDTDAIINNPKIQSGLIYLKGMLGRLDIDKIHVLIREVLNDHVDTTHIRIYQQIHVCHSLKDKKPVSLLVFKLAIHGKPVHNHLLHFTMEKLATEDYKIRFPKPVTSRSECEGTPESRASTVKSSGWKDKYWIYVLVMAFVCIIAMIVVILIVRDRRRHKWQPYSSSVLFTRLDENAPNREQAALQSTRKSQDYDVLVNLDQQQQRRSGGEPRNFRLSSSYN